MEIKVTPPVHEPSPDPRAGNLTAMSEAIHTHRAVTSATPEAAWLRLQDPATWATVAGVHETRAHTYDGDLLVGFDFSARIAGLTYRGSARVTEATSPVRMTLGIRSRELTGSIAVVLDPGNPGTTVAVTLTMRPAGFMGAMVFGVASAAVESGFTDSVERLASELG